MYDVNDNHRATNDQDALRDAIVTHVRQHFDSSFETAFSTAVLLMVPILRPDGPETITVLPTPHFAFLLPIKWDALRPLPKTIFSMSFDAPPISGARTLVPGTIYLAPSERFPAPGGALIASPIHECKNHPLGFHIDGHQRSQAECSTIDWSNDPKVQALFTAAVLRTATVEAGHYRTGHPMNGRSGMRKLRAGFAATVMVSPRRWSGRSHERRRAQLCIAARARPRSTGPGPLRSRGSGLRRTEHPMHRI